MKNEISFVKNAGFLLENGEFCTKSDDFMYANRLALTVMVPLGSFAFALPFMPQAQPVKLTDVAGLLVILGGLVLYLL